MSITQVQGRPLRNWMDPRQARALIEAFGYSSEDAGAVLRDAAVDDVPLRFIHADKTTDEVPAEDRKRIAINHETGRAWLVGELGRLDQIVTAPAPDPPWGEPFEVKSSALREHLQRLAPPSREEARPSRGRGGRPPHAAKVFAIKAAILWLEENGPPEPRALLVRHLQEQIAGHGFGEPDESTVKDWAREFTDFWIQVINVRGGGK
jgi:hypothetical protein